jgi:thioredoxin-related protein
MNSTNSTVRPDIRWRRDLSDALKEAAAGDHLALLYFPDEPTCAGCARLEGDVYPVESVAVFIESSFVPVKLDIKEQPQQAGRFSVDWTPTLLVVEPDGTERHRTVGFLPAEELLAELELAMAKADFSRGDHEAAARRFTSTAERFADAGVAAEALYWSGVAAFKADGEFHHLAQLARALHERYPVSTWAMRASVWDA